MSDQEAELFRQLSHQRSKYIYFLLASAGACLAFSMTQTDELALEWPNQPILAALVLWGVSIISGIRVLQITDAISFTNFGMLKTQSENHPMYRDLIYNVANKDHISPLNKKVVLWRKMQLYSLLLGAVLLVFWKIASAYSDFEVLLQTVGMT